MHPNLPNPADADDAHPVAASATCSKIGNTSPRAAWPAAGAPGAHDARRMPSFMALLRASTCAARSWAQPLEYTVRLHNTQCRIYVYYILKYIYIYIYILYVYNTT